MVPDNNPFHRKQGESSSAVTNKNSVCMHREQPIHSLQPEVYLSPVYVCLGNLIRNHVVSSNTMLLFVPNDPETFPPIFLVHLCFLWFAGTWPIVSFLLHLHLFRRQWYFAFSRALAHPLLTTNVTTSRMPAASLTPPFLHYSQHTSLGISCTTALLSNNTPGTRTKYPRKSQNGLTDVIPSRKPTT